MAACAMCAFLLLCGVGTMLQTTHIAVMGADSPRESVNIDSRPLNLQESGADNEDRLLQTRGLWDILDLSSLFNSVFRGTNVFDNGAFQNSINHDNSDQDLKGSSIIVGGSTSIINIGSDGIIDEGISSGKNFGGCIKMDTNGLIIRILNIGNKGIRMRGKEIFRGDQLICADSRKRTAKPTHQKTPDGARWYTNIKVGEPMSQVEAEQFDKDWTENEKQRKARSAALDARLKREEEERERERKQREAERNDREMRREEEREREEKKRETERQEREMRREKEREMEEKRREREEKEREMRREREEKQREKEEKEREMRREREEKQRETEREEREMRREKEMARQEEERDRREKERERRQDKRMERARRPSWSRKSSDSFSWW